MLNMIERRWVELLSDYDCELKYHPGKANVVADALSRKERLRPSRVRALGMLVQTSLTFRILEAQRKAIKEENLEEEALSGANQKLETGADGIKYLNGRAWIPKVNNLRKVVIDEAHRSRKCLTCAKVKGEHQKLSGLLQTVNSSVEMGKDYDGSDRDSRFTSRFQRLLQKALGIQLDMSIAYHPQTDGQSERTIQTLEDMLRACVIDLGGSWDTHLPLVEFSYNNSYHTSIKCAPFEALYGRKCRSPLCWLETGDRQLTRLDVIQETVDKITVIKERLKTARSRQKSYSDNHKKPLEFQVRDQVLLKVSPWKGMIRFEK
ncbi:putative reverse transcriptase domain-containing protein [Tanacetum coccineum]